MRRLAAVVVLVGACTRGGDGTDGAGADATGEGDAGTTGDGDGDGDGDSDGDGDGDDPEVPTTPYCYPVAGLMWLDPWREDEQAVLALVNAARAAGAQCGAHGSMPPAEPLAMQPELRCAARVHARDMNDRMFFDHVNPDGEDPGDRIALAGYGAAAWAENIAKGAVTPDDAVAGWLDSDDHCAILMSSEFTESGVGSFEGENGLYWTQTFGRPN
jgi:hypothetical protein